MRRLQLITATFILSSSLALAQPPENSKRNKQQGSPSQHQLHGRSIQQPLPDLNPKADPRPPAKVSSGEAHQALIQLQHDLEAKGLSSEAKRLAEIIRSLPPENHPNDGVRPEQKDENAREGGRGSNRRQGDGQPNDRQLSGRDILVQRMMLGENVERYSTKVLELEKLKSNTNDPVKLKKLDKAIKLQKQKRGVFLEDFRKNAPEVLERLDTMEERIESSTRFQQVTPEMKEHLQSTRELLSSPSSDDEKLFQQLQKHINETPFPTDDTMKKESMRGSDQHLKRIEREIKALENRLKTLEEERGVLDQPMNPTSS